VTNPVTLRSSVAIGATAFAMTVLAILGGLLLARTMNFA
jgi:hypothetical protein